MDCAAGTLAIALAADRPPDTDGRPKSVAAGSCARARDASGVLCAVDAAFQAAMQDEVAALTRAYLEGSSNGHPGTAVDPEGAASREAAEGSSAAVGDSFPVSHALIDSSGAVTDLRSAVQKGPLIVTYFRGNWCTLCMLALRHLSQAAPIFQACYGASLVAISGQLAPHNRACESSSNLGFPVLCDKGLGLAQKLGIVFNLTEQEARFYDHICWCGFDGTYGPGHHFQLPLPATFVLQQGSGDIAYAFVDSDLTKRSRMLRIEAALDNLVKDSVIAADCS